MDSEKKFKYFMSKFQPGKNELLINNQWGVPLPDIDKSEAGKRGLTKWNNRWVTKEELGTLKPQYRAYMRIRWTAFIIFFIGLFAVTLAIDKYKTFPTDTRELVFALSLFLYPVFHVIVGFGLLKYKNWARWVAVILFPLLIPPKTFYSFQTDKIFKLYVVVAIFFAFVLFSVFSKNGRIIFNSKKVAYAESDS